MQSFRTNHLKSYLEVHLPLLLMWTPTWEVVLSHEHRQEPTWKLATNMALLAKLTWTIYD
jgi:hypothetical protein